MRIACLLPAATEIACLLGLREQLVGRSHECDFPEGVTTLPALTRARVDSSLESAALDTEVREIFRQGLPLYDLDEARLAELRPDVIVTQQACEVCAVSYEQVQGSVRRACLASNVIALEPTAARGLLAAALGLATARRSTSIVWWSTLRPFAAVWADAWCARRWRCRVTRA